MQHKLNKQIEQLSLTPEMKMEVKNLVIHKSKPERIRKSAKGVMDKRLAKANSQLFKQLQEEFDLEIILNKQFIITDIYKHEKTLLPSKFKERLQGEDFLSFFEKTQHDKIYNKLKKLVPSEITPFKETIFPDDENKNLGLKGGWCQATASQYSILLKKQANDWSLFKENGFYIIFEINLHGKLLRFNESFTNKLIAKKQDLLNSHIKDWLHPLYISNMETILSRVIYENESRSQTVFFKNDDPKNGMGYSCTFIPNIESRTISVVGFQTHTTEQDDDGLFMDEQLYITLAENLPDMNVFLFNREYKFLLVAGKELGTRGFDRNHFEGRSLSQVYNHDILSEIKPVYDAALEGRTISREILLNEQYYRMESVPLQNKDSQVYAGMVISQNISQDKEVENQLKIAKEEAENSSRTKTEFLANMSHEIRTPLNAIVGFSEQLIKSSLNDKQNRFAQLITDSSNHLLSIVNEILILFKLEAGKVAIEKDYFRLHSIIEDIHELFRIRAAKKSLDFSFTIDENISPVLLGDSFRLKQILINLISNALKFTDFGSVALDVGLEKREDKEQRLKFSIKDTGIGLDENELQTIFTEFNQGDVSITRRFGGSGLGLTITKKLVDLHGGKISVQSAKNVGSEFAVYLPFQAGNDSDIVVREPMIEIDKNLLANIGKILLVDDDETNRFLGETILNNWGLSFDLAADGDEAIQKLSANTYDLLLLDIHMPKISGIDVTKYIRSQKNNPNREVKIIAITANIVRGDVIRYMSAGMDNYIIKPFREQELFNKICHVFQISANPEDNEKIEEELLVLKEIKTEEKKPFKLDELLHVAKGDPKFFNKMIISFISNTRSGLERIQTEQEKKQWDLVGESAHKLISSCRFFQLNEMAEALKEIENNTLVEKKPAHAEKYIAIFEESAKKVLPLLEAEMIKDENHLKS